eukprot:g40614.t1
MPRQKKNNDGYKAGRGKGRGGRQQRGAKEAKSAEAKVAFESASVTIGLIESSDSASSIPKMSLIFIPEDKPSTH